MTRRSSANETWSKDLIAQLKRMRVAAGLTQGQLGQKLGMHRPNICRIERGLHTPDLSTISAWAIACGGRAKLVFEQLTAEPVGDIRE